MMKAINAKEEIVVLNVAELEVAAIAYLKNHQKKYKKYDLQAVGDVVNGKPIVRINVKK